MDTSNRVSGHDPGAAGLAKLERSLHRALATAESEETRYHVRTALQQVAVLCEPPWESPGAPQRPAERQ
ncbi:hypothetical protein [Halobaculum gomorrense]|uniref:Uncharacterized protein n=1 Tax=Halobaculum gomorrense TaxID=43928 RepID=A0A1M5PME6_9EURY|nr:hypothetical protein [Halobaculum gomorrense]SHH02958.1 hypothetical protein SAMN05443636_1669 [Halobaculum gomorrense]